MTDKTGYTKSILVDIGATNLRVAIGESGGRILGKLSQPTRKLGKSNAIPNQIIEMASKLMQKITIFKSDLISIAIGSVGPIDATKGTIVSTANLPYTDVPLREHLMGRFDVPVGLLGDCVAGVLGEQKFGAAKNVGNVVYVTFSTGIGVGAMVDGHLLEGRMGNAAMAGHMIVSLQSDMICGCGQRGHWEAYSSARNIPNYAKSIMRSLEDSDSALMKIYRNDPTKITSRSVFDAAKSSDSVAKIIVNRIGEVNSKALANLLVAYDPELLVLGGALTLTHPEFIIGPIRRMLSKYCIFQRLPRIIKTRLGDDAVLYGALASTQEVT